MKTTRKLLSMVMAMVLLAAMAVCMPAMAVETTYTAGVNPTFEMEGLSYTVTAGSVTVTDAAAFAGDTNASQKIKITNAEDTTTTVSVNLLAAGLQTGTIEITTDFVITDLQQVEGAETPRGLTVIKTRTGYTDSSANEKIAGVFTKVSDWWRTAMLSDSSRMNMTLTMTFEGKGTVYIDNPTFTTTRTLSNADFKGLENEYRPAAWSFQKDRNNNDFVITDETDTESKGWRLVQTKDGNYLTATKIGRSLSITQDILADYIESGVLYRLSVETKGDNIAFRTNAGGSVLPLGDSLYASYTKATEDWQDKSITLKGHNCPEGVARTTNFRVAIVPFNGVGYIRNVRVEKISEDCNVVNEQGVAVNTVSAGKYIVNYTYPLADIQTLTYATTDSYSKEIGEANSATSTTKLRAIVAVYKEGEDGKHLNKVILSDELASKVLLPSYPSGSVDNTANDIGILPATMTPVPVEIPNDGNKYSIKVMAWSDLGGLVPHTSGFTFPAAE